MAKDWKLLYKDLEKKNKKLTFDNDELRKVNGELKGEEYTCDCGGLLLDKFTWEYEQNRDNPKPEPEPEPVSDEQKDFHKSLELLTGKMSV